MKPIMIHRTDTTTDADEKRITHSVVSHNKCGRTLLRITLYHVFLDTFGSLSARGSVFSSDIVGYGPCVLFSHDPRRFRQGKTIILVRDPRDVMVSWYFHVTHRRIATIGSERLPKGFPISEFIRSDYWGMPNYIQYATYIEQQHPVGCHYMWHEQTLSNSYREIRKLCDYLGIQTTSKVIQKAVDKSNFKFVKQCVADGNYADFYPLPPRGEDGDFTDDFKHYIPADNKDKESFALRKGKVGGYLDYLNDEDVQYLNDQMEELPGRWRY